MHFAYQWKFAYVLCRQFPATMGTDRVASMGWHEYLWVAVPCGLVTSLDVGLSNLSLVTISITFYTMVKASTPVFVLAWAYVFGIERITLNLLIVVAIIATGEFLTVIGEVEFQIGGFVLCLCASVMSGARWTLVQLKLQTLDPPLKTTIAAMKMLAPSMFFSMFVISLCVERPWNKFGHMDGGQVLHILGLGSVGAAFAIAMILCEFYLIMYSSAVILMIGGVLKEMVTIIMGVTIFHDELNRINVAGCFVVFLGILFYKVTFHLDKQRRGDDKPPHLRGPRQYRAVQADEGEIDGSDRCVGSESSDDGGASAGLDGSPLTRRRRTTPPPLPSLSLDEPPEMKRSGASALPSSKPNSSVMELQNADLRSRGSGPRSRESSPTSSPRGPPKAFLV
jgi:solute carrier family 35 protein C2